MKQIKTIYEGDPRKFDDKVNDALAEGWSLEKRSNHQYGFIAEMERDIITEDEKTCANCKHGHVDPMHEPCASCDPENGTCHWEAEV